MRVLILSTLSLAMIGCSNSIIGPVNVPEPIEPTVEVIDSIQYNVSADINNYLNDNKILIATDISPTERVVHNTSVPNISNAFGLGYDSTKGDTIIIDSSREWVTFTYTWKGGYLIEWFNIYHQSPYIGTEMEKHQYEYFGGRLIQEKIYSFGSWTHTIKVTYFKHYI